VEAPPIGMRVLLVRQRQRHCLCDRFLKGDRHGARLVTLIARGCGAHQLVDVLKRPAGWLDVETLPT
jgi:hypothetical protein